MIPVPSPVLPESRHLRFDCGVTVQLGFAAEFSNIMIIYTRVVAAPKDITKCEARLTDIPEVGAAAEAPNQGSPGKQGEKAVMVFTWMPSMAGAGCGPQMHQQGEPRGAGQSTGICLEPWLPLLLPLQPDLWLAEAAGKSRGGQGLVVLV